MRRRFSAIREKPEGRAFFAPHPPPVRVPFFQYLLTIELDTLCKNFNPRSMAGDFLTTGYEFRDTR